MQGLTTLFIRRYILCVAAKSAHGIGVPDIKTTHNRVRGFFMRSARLHKNYGGLCEGFFGSAGFRFDRLRQPCTVHHQLIGVVGGDSSNSKRDYRYGHSALMNPLMILVKIIKLRWIHILSYDQMVSRKINNQTTRCANSIFYTTLFTNSAPNYT